MIKIIDNFLNKITMYRLVLYSLWVLFVYSILLSAFGVLDFSPFAVLFSGLFIMTVCLATNKFITYFLNTPINSESVFITALILFLIISPISQDNTQSFFILATFGSMLAMATKYALAINRKHIFNPAAIGVAMVAIFYGISASWWVATMWMMPVVLITGLLITRKTQRFDLVLAFLVTTFILLVSKWYLGNTATNLGQALYRSIFLSPILFFAFYMLTEPLTTPPTRRLRIIYGILVGVLFSPNFNFGFYHSTPELALVIGNLFSYVISPKFKLFLFINNISEIARDTYEFSFKKKQYINFEPGQYMEFTIKDPLPDNRGNRRYFTIASSPTEKDFLLGVKYYSGASSFKLKLANLDDGDIVVASQLAGDFTMPKDPKKKLVFIAGGIAVTPFRSMIKYLIDTKEQRDIVLLYSNSTKDDIAYQNIFDQARRVIGLRTIYSLTEKGQFATRADFVNTQIDKNLILKQIPDFRERVFYISGPISMVHFFRDVLYEMGVPRSQIKTDFFPGFA